MARGDQQSTLLSVACKTNKVPRVGVGATTFSLWVPLRLSARVSQSGSRCWIDVGPLSIAVESLFVFSVISGFGSFLRMAFAVWSMVCSLAIEVVLPF